MSTLHLRCSHEDDLDGLSRRDGAKHYGSVDQIFYDKGEFKVVHCKAPEPNGQRERSTRTKQERETKAQQLVQSQDQGFRTSQVVGPALGNVPDVESEDGSSDISKIRVESEDFFYSSRTHFENDMKSDDTTAEKTTPVLMIPSRTFYDDAPPIALQGPAADLRYLPAELKDRMLSRQFEEAAQLENESNEPATNGKVTGATASRNGCGNSTTVPAQKNRKDVAELVHLHGEANKQTVRQSTVIIPALTVLPGVLESCNSVEQDRRVAAQIPVSGSADSHKETTATDHDQEQKTKAKSLLSAMETRLKVTKEEAFIANDSREKTEMQVQNDETHVVISADEEEDHVQTDIQCPSVTTDAAENRDATVRRPSKENNSNFQEYFSTQSEQKTAAKTDNETLRQQQQLLLRSEQLQNERLEDLGQPGVLQQNQANGILADNENWQQLRPVRDNRRDEDTFCGRMDTIEVIYEDEELILPERSSELEGIEYVKTREDEDAYGDESKLNINEENDYNRDWTASWMSRKRYSDSYFGLAKPCEIITESAEDVSVDPENSRYLGTSDWNLQQGDNSVETLPTTDGLHNNCGDDDADDDDGDIGEVDFISTESIFGDFDELAVSRDHWLWRRRDWQRCLSASELEYVDPLDWYEGRSLSSGCILMPNCFEPNQHAGSTDSITYFFLGPEDSCPSRRHSSASVYAAAPTEGRCETGTFENVPGSSRKRRLSLPVCRLTPSQPKAVEIIDHTLFSSSTNEGRLSENNTLEKESASIPDWKSSVGERILPIGSSGQLNRRLVKRNSLGSGRLDCRQTTFVNFKNRKISPSGSNTEIPSTPENITRIRHPLASDNSLNLNAQTLLGRKLIRHVASDSTTAPVDSHASTREVVSTETSISAANVTLGATSKKFFLFSSPALNSYPSTKTAETQTYPETKVIEVQTSPNEISARAHFVWSSSTTESVKPTNIDATASLDSLADVKASAVPLYSDSYGTADGADSNRVPPSLVGSQDLGSQITSNRSTTPDMYYDSTSIHEDAMSERNMPNGRSVNRLNEQTDEITHEHKSSYRTSSSSSNRENQLTSTATTGKEIRYYDRPIRSNDNAWHSDLTNPPPTKHLCSPIRPLHRSFVDDVIENTYGVTSPQLNGLLQRSTSRFSQRNALTDGRHAVVDSHRSRDDIFSTDIRCDLPKYERSGRHFSMFNTDSFSFGDSLPEAPGRYTSGNRMEHDRPAAASNLCSLRGNEATRNESVDWENYLKYSNDNDNRAKNRFSLTNTDFDTDVNFREENTVTTFDDNLQYNESFGSSNNTRLQHSSTNNRRELQLEKNWSDSRRRKEYSRDFSSAGTSALSFPLVQTGELTFLSPPEFSSGYQVPERDPAREPNKGRDTWTTTTIDLSQPFYDRLSQDIRHRGEDIIGSSTASSSLETNVWTEERNTLRNRRSTNVHSNEPSFVRDDDEIGRLRRERRRLLRLLVADVNASEMRTEYVETELRLQLRLTDRLLRSLHDDDDCTWII